MHACGALSLGDTIWPDAETARPSQKPSRALCVGTAASRVCMQNATPFAPSPWRREGTHAGAKQRAPLAMRAPVWRSAHVPLGRLGKSLGRCTGKADRRLSRAHDRGTRSAGLICMEAPAAGWLLKNGVPVVLAAAAALNPHGASAEGDMRTPAGDAPRQRPNPRSDRRNGRAALDGDSS
ncbi:hypothetical protein MRX96_014390 [Rhipicephalus microplus]